MRIFASDRVAGLMQKLGMEKGEAIEHPWVSKAIENAQRKVEQHNYNMRKTLLEYDDVANDQRTVVYEQRDELMETDNVSGIVDAIREDVVNALISEYMPPGSLDEQWDIAGLEEAIAKEYGQEMPVGQWLEEDDELHEETLRARIIETMLAAYRQKEQDAGVEVVRHFEKAVMLQILDGAWKEHLAAMDYLRQGIGLRGYGQKDPKQEYKREAFALFESLLETVKFEIVGLLSKVQFRSEEELAQMEAERERQQMQFEHPTLNAESAAEAAGQYANREVPEKSAEPVVKGADETYVRQGQKIGRNEPCPCGSGKKYKKCHGQLN